MKHYYYFIRKAGKFDPDDVVYKVAAGSSTREQTKLALIREYCKDCGLYFAQVSAQSDSSIEKLAESLFNKGIVSKLFLRIRTISVTECYRRIIDNSFQSFEDSSSECPSFFHQLSTVSFNFLPSKSSPKAEKDCPGVTRKHLSRKMEMSVQGAVFNFGVILAVFIFCAWLEGKAMAWWPDWF